MEIKNGDASYIACDDCGRRVTGYIKQERLKKAVRADVDVQCPSCNTIMHMEEEREE